MGKRVKHAGEMCIGEAIYFIGALRIRIESRCRFRCRSYVSLIFAILISVSILSVLPLFLSRGFLNEMKHVGQLCTILRKESLAVGQRHISDVNLCDI